MSRLVWKIIQMKMARAIHLEAGRKCQHRTMICPKNRDQKDERGDQIGPRIHDVKQKVTRFFVNLNSPSNHPTVHRQLGISHLFFCKVGIIHIRAHIRCKFSFHWLFFFLPKSVPSSRLIELHLCDLKGWNDEEINPRVGACRWQKSVPAGEGFILFVLLKINDNETVTCHLLSFPDFQGSISLNLI